MWKTASGVSLCGLLVLAGVWRSQAGEQAGYAEVTRAIRNNDLEGVRALAADPNVLKSTGPLGYTALHYAAIYGSADAMGILLRAGADPNARDRTGATALHYGAYCLDKVLLLVGAGADVKAAENGGATALMIASAAPGNVRTVRFLLEKGADVRGRDQFGDNALIRAAANGDREVQELLLQRGAESRAVDRAGLTALNITTASAAMTRQLLAAGADANAANVFGGRVLKGNIALVHLTPLMVAAPYAEQGVIPALLGSGARVNEVDIRKMTPLMLSIASDQAKPENVRQLVAAGAEVNAEDQNGETALTWARKFRNPEIVGMLEKAGARGGELAPAPRPDENASAKSAEDAVRRAMPLLTRTAPQFFREGGCVGCHHQPAYAQVFGAAKRAGLAPDPALRTAFLGGMISMRPRLAPTLPVLRGPGGDIDPLLYALAAYDELGEAPNEDTDLLVHYIAVRQDAAGSWSALGIARPPIEDSSITRTSLAMRALKHYGWRARQPEFEERIARARKWLEAAAPVTTYERADQITGLYEAGLTREELRGKTEALLKLQRGDGGWAQTKYLDSDAYATGLVLHSLYRTGLITPADEAYRRGVAFLLRTQFADGSWYVRSRAPKFQPYFQSGFPFDHDQWISSAGTAYALMALADGVNGGSERKR
ncbi:MAG TPA: ankyrin repeat domain-containing protein [Bryobacteraceae bacterium]|jgi:ankyrin repeat protein|nr:ankyrin repeat domain-containing protein [Bryobacteraceae bacterium]